MLEQMKWLDEIVIAVIKSVALRDRLDHRISYRSSKSSCVRDPTLSRTAPSKQVMRSSVTEIYDTLYNGPQTILMLGQFNIMNYWKGKGSHVKVSDFFEKFDPIVKGDPGWNL